MKINHQNRLFFDMVLLARKTIHSMSEEDRQLLYGSDYYSELKKYIDSFEPVDYDWLDFLVDKKWIKRRKSND